MTDHEKLMLIKKMTEDICEYDIQDEGWLRAAIEHINMVTGFECDPDLVLADCERGEDPSLRSG